MVYNFSIVKLTRELNVLSAKYSKKVPIEDCAEFLGITVDELGSSIEQGRCPFAFCLIHEQKYHYVIPTLSLNKFMIHELEKLGPVDSIAMAIKKVI